MSDRLKNAVLRARPVAELGLLVVTVAHVLAIGAVCVFAMIRPGYAPIPYIGLTVFDAIGFAVQSFAVCMIVAALIFFNQDRVRLLGSLMFWGATFSIFAFFGSEPIISGAGAVAVVKYSLYVVGIGGVAMMHFGSGLKALAKGRNQAA